MSAPRMIDVDIPKLGLYSHAAETPVGSRILFMGGRAGLCSDGSVAGTDVDSQFRQAFQNIGTTLASVGMDYSNLVQLTTYLTSADDIKAFYDARASLYSEIYPNGVYPPNTLLMVERLVEPNLRIEVTGIAAG